MSTKSMTAIDLFCGCGGFSLGFINSGWHVVAALDASIMALWTYYHNLCDEDTKLIGEFSRKDMINIEETRRDWRMFDSKGYDATTGPGYRRSSLHAENQEWILRDMLPEQGGTLNRHSFPAVNALFYNKAQDITGYDILDAISDITNGEQIGVVIGGPPCQGFSRSNKNRHVTDARNFLVFEFGRLVMEINPKTFVMENVPDINKFKLPDGRNLIEVFQKMITNRDWDLYFEVQGLYIDGDIDPDHECTIGPQQEKERFIQSTLQAVIC
jgi:DNA (cytosine-5)-methyltransferase 1